MRESHGPGENEPAFLAIVGATAAGKTGLSLEVGRALGAEIVSMDSRQIYRGMDIGTGKVTLAERAILPHHGLDLMDPDGRYSAGRFARDTRRWIRDIRSRGRIPLLVGGTGFFLRALTQPMFSEPRLSQPRLEALREQLNQLPPAELRRWADVLDPEWGGENGEGGRHRLTRRIEMPLLTGRPLSWWHREERPEEPPLEGRVVLLDLPRELLYERINRRVGDMVRGGLVEEVEGLLSAGFGPEDPGMTGAGYREMVEYLEGKEPLEEATDRIRQSHRNYARRQITWFRHQLPPESVGVDGTRDRGELVREVCRVWNTGKTAKA